MGLCSWVRYGFLFVLPTFDVIVAMNGTLCILYGWLAARLQSFLLLSALLRVLPY